MASTTALGRTLRFGTFELNVATGELRKSGLRLKLRPQAAKVLAVLASRHAETVTREQLKQEIWGSTFFVDFEHGLNLCIRQIRAALNDDADKPRYIETIPRHGYRFIARVEEVATPLPAAPVQDSNRELVISPGAATVPVLVAQRRFTLRLMASMAAILSVIAGTALLLANVRGWRTHLLGGSSSSVRSIAVLPLLNLTGDAAQDYFADGLTDVLITDLAKVHALRVISRSSTMQYKGKRESAPQIARELKVDAIVEGTVMRSGDRVRVTAQLIEAPKDRHLWAETYERDSRDILALQDEVAKTIAGEVKITLTPEEQSRLSNARQVQPAANEAYLRGLYELHGMTAEPSEALQFQSLEKAIGYFEQSLTYDKNNALAYSGLADAYCNLSTEYRAPLEVMPKARAAATKAIELDDTLAEAHASLAYVEFLFDWDWSRAEREFRRALELNPSLPRAHAGYAAYLLSVGHRTDEGLQELHHAYALDPLLPFQQGDLAFFLFLARRYTESIEAAQRVGHDDHILALSYAELGQSEQALAVADRAVKSTQNPVILSQVAAAYALAGKKDKARALLHEIEGPEHRYVCGFNVACAYSVLGDKEQALAWLEKAYRDRSD